MNRSAATRIFALWICSATMPCVSQTTPTLAAASVSRFAGCVQHSTTDKNLIILSGETICAKLTGSFSADKLIGHEVDLKGVLTARTPSAPAEIRVGSINSVGKLCSDLCVLQPPGTRGLKGGEKPGKEGGTPGATPTKPPQ